MNFLYRIFIKPFVNRYRRWNRKTTLSKRQQFVIITMILTGGLVATQVVPVEYRYQMVSGLGVMSLILTAFGLRDDLSKIEYLTLLMLPVFFTVAVSLFYFLLPVRWLTRIPIALLYTLGIYALLLTENIYNVAANRTIALLRAAHTVGFLITLVTFFFLAQTVFAWWTYPWFNIIAVFFISYFLAIQSLWSVTLEDHLDRRVTNLSLCVSVILTEVCWGLSFWPVNATIKVLFLTTVFYSMIGMAQQYLQERLYKKTLMEFLSVTIIVLLIVIFATHWRGNN